MPRKTVFVAMSGGVDSSVAALLLQREGHEVVGVTLKLFANEDIGEPGDSPCCSEESAELARSVCCRLGIPHHMLNFTDIFERDVIAPFVFAYAAGLTPNPCIECNRRVKLAAFLQKALALGADAVGTGHHARIERHESGECRLLPGLDPAKDQSYALLHLNQATMPRVLLPVGHYRKAEVREIAGSAGLRTAAAPESQDICFVRQGSCRDFLLLRGLRDSPGPIVALAGEVVGRHRGLHRYTVGQRRGLGLSAGERLYVIEKRMADNALVVGLLDELGTTRVRVRDVSWCGLPEGEWPAHPPAPLTAMLRYRSARVPCAIEEWSPQERSICLRFATPVVAAPGQFAVMYAPDDGHVVGGGAIA